MNAYRGEGEIVLNGRSLPVRFDWTAIARVKNEFPDGWKSDDIAHISKMLEIGLSHLNDPTLTAEFIVAVSPPLMPTIQALLTAQHRAWYGIDEAPQEAAKENPPMKTGSSDGGGSPFESASVLNGSGGQPPSS